MSGAPERAEACEPRPVVGHPGVGRQGKVIGSRVHAVTAGDALDHIMSWAQAGRTGMVCFVNAHSLVTARRLGRLAQALAAADLCLPDGAPVAWMLSRLLGVRQLRVSGPDLMWACMGEAARRHQPVFLYGSSPSTLGALEERLREAFPGLVIAGACSPPFRPLTPDEEEAIVARINASGARMLWVGLGCPKQELWMHQHVGRIHPVMLGVGAAFDFHAGVRARAPRWMREHGLEWMHRLFQEPGRLTHRYLSTNAGFAWAALMQLLRGGRA